MTSNENTTSEDVLVTRTMFLPKKLDIVLRTIGHGSGASKNKIISILITMEMAKIKPDDELFDLTSADATCEPVQISFNLASRLDAKLRDLAKDKKLNNSNLIQNLLERSLRRPDCIFRKYLDPSHLEYLFPTNAELQQVDHLINQLHRAGVEHYDEGNYPDALRSFELELALSLKNNRDSFRARKFVAMLQTALGRYDEADNDLRFLSDAIKEDEDRISDVEKIEVLNALARVYRIRGKWTECDKTITEAEMTAMDSSAAAVKLAHIHTKAILAEVYLVFTEHSAAKETALEALNELNEISKDADATIQRKVRLTECFLKTKLATIIFLAHLRRDEEKKIAKDEIPDCKSFDFYREYIERPLNELILLFGTASHPALASVYNRKGLYELYVQEAYDLALNSFEQALLARQSGLSPHRDLHSAYAFNNIGAAMLKVEKVSLAIDYCRRGLTLKVELLGIEHVDVAYSLSTLALCLEDKEEATRVRAASEAIRKEQSKVRRNLFKTKERFNSQA